MDFLCFHLLQNKRKKGQLNLLLGGKFILIKSTCKLINRQVSHDWESWFCGGLPCHADNASNRLKNKSNFRWYLVKFEIFIRWWDSQYSQQFSVWYDMAILRDIFAGGILLVFLGEFQGSFWTIWCYWDFIQCRPLLGTSRPCKYSRMLRLE